MDVSEKGAGEHRNEASLNSGVRSALWLGAGPAVYWCWTASRRELAFANGEIYMALNEPVQPALPGYDPAVSMWVPAVCASLTFAMAIFSAMTRRDEVPVLLTTLLVVGLKALTIGVAVCLHG